MGAGYPSGAQDTGSLCPWRLAKQALPFWGSWQPPGRPWLSLQLHQLPWGRGLRLPGLKGPSQDLPLLGGRWAPGPRSSNSNHKHMSIAWATGGVGPALTRNKSVLNHPAILALLAVREETEARSYRGSICSELVERASRRPKIWT